MVYEQYDGPLAQLAERVVAETRDADVLLPFETYVYPTTRFLLHDEFRESQTPPPVRPNRPATLVTIPHSTPFAYVWLTRDESGRGIAYVPPPQPWDRLDSEELTGEAVAFLNPYTGESIAELTRLENAQTLLSSLAHRQLRYPVDYYWADEAHLLGYQVQPTWVQPGQPVALDLYWQSLTDQPREYKTFVQLVNARGESITEGDGHFFLEAFRWRKGGNVPDQYVLWTGSQALPGPYVVRLGLFYPTTGERIPIHAPDGELLGDHIVLGLFYVTDGEGDPRLPQIPLRARLGQQIELLGYSSLRLDDQPARLVVRLHWQAGGRANGDYTTFVQLLDAQNELVTSWDTQPLAGQYPTSRWQPGEIVVDEFELPLPDELLPGDYRLVTGMYDAATGQRLPAVGAEGQPLADDMILLAEMKLSE
jgi:hypothetical protein